MYLKCCEIEPTEPFEPRPKIIPSAAPCPEPLALPKNRQNHPNAGKNNSEKCGG